MNFPRLIGSAAAAWLVDIAFSYVAYDLFLGDIWLAHEAVFRAAGERNLLLGYGVSFIGFFLFAYMYAKGYEGTNGLAEGLRFGVLVGILLVCFATIWAYVLLPVSPLFGLSIVVATLVEFTLVGLIVGAIYQPAPVPRVRRPGRY